MREIELYFFSKRYSISFFKRINPRWLIFLIDLFICAVSILLSFQLRFNFSVPENTINSMWYAVMVILAIRAISFLISRTYAGIVRYTGMKDIFKVLYVNAIGSVVIVTMGIIKSNFFGSNYLAPISVLAIDFFITIVLMLLFRIGVRVLYIELSHISVPKTNVIIYGSRELAVLAKRALELDSQNHYKVVAFISTSQLMLGKKLEDVNVYPPEDLEKLIYKFNVGQLLFASSKVKTEKEHEVAQICLDNHVKVFNIPSINDLIKGNLSVNTIKKLRIEDLLSRNPIVLDSTGVRAHLENKTILITGAAGSIGSEIVRQIMAFPFKRLILVDQAETPLYNLEMELVNHFRRNACEFVVADITSRNRMEKLFSIYRPEIVYHAAAYKHVPMMENNPSSAIMNNVMGTKILADLSNLYKVSRFIFISTDKAVNPTNVMGASKRIAEMYIQALNNLSGTAFITTRFGNVLGSNGSVIPFFKRQIEAGGPVTVTHPEVTRFFMTIPEACQLVLEAGTFGKGGEIFVFDMGQSVKIIDLARNMIRLAGLEPDVDIQIKFTGLRPGEKLYEEVLHQSEGTIPTHHPKILIAKVREQNMDAIQQKIQLMENAIKGQNNNELVKEMKRTVPEFISQNSIFEQIDKESHFVKVSSLKAV